LPGDWRRAPIYPDHGDLSLANTLALVPVTPRLGDIRKARIDRPALILTADGYVLA